MKKSTYCFLGDSITEGVGVKVGERYFDEIGRRLDVNAVSYGVNGAQTVALPEQIERMQKEQGSEVDTVFVLTGTNDFYHNVPIGSFFEEYVGEVTTLFDDNGNSLQSQLRKKRRFCYDKFTFCGRLNTAFSKIRNYYPTARIIILTPIHRGYACFSTENIQPDDLTANAIGLFFDEYIDAVRKCADIWSLKLIDLYRDSGLFPLNDDNAKAFYCNATNDRLHPSANGHARMAETILENL